MMGRTVFCLRFRPAYLPCSKDHLEEGLDRKHEARGHSPSGFTSWIHLREGISTSTHNLSNMATNLDAAAVPREGTPTPSDKRVCTMQPFIYFVAIHLFIHALLCLSQVFAVFFTRVMEVKWGERHLHGFVQTPTALR